MTQIVLNDNGLIGTIPAVLGNLAGLYELDLSSNQLVGEIPSSILNLGNLMPGQDGGVWYHGLSSADAGVLAFMQTSFPDWQLTQTVPPANVSVSSLGPGSAVVSWDTIPYTSEPGYYEVGISQTSGGPYTLSPQNQTTSKSASQITITGLAPGDNYVVVQTVTPANWNNRNTVTSLPSPEVDLAWNPLGVPDAEYEALVALYNSTNGPGWTNSTNWLTGNTPWHGVWVSGGHVVKISLDDNHLVGTIPPQIGSLTGLNVLELAANYLSGLIPAEIDSAGSLYELDLSRNDLTGEIPSWVTNLPCGQGPPGILYNGLSSTDPAVLAFMNEHFPTWQSTQTLPPASVSAAALSSPNAAVSLTPVSYTGDPGYFEVGISQTSGGPYTFSPQNQTDSKSTLQLTITGLASGDNYIVVQTVTPACRNNQNCVTSIPSQEIDVPWNAMGVPDGEYQALAALYNGTNGPGWRTSTNWLTSGAPWYGVTVAGGHVTGIALVNDGLNGTIPPEIGNLVNLQKLWLNSNHLSGTIPAELGNLVNLGDLNLSNNKLSGTMPSELGSLVNLRDLNLSYNQLSGTIPSELGSLTDLQLLYLSTNELSGAIPPELGSLVNLQGLDLSGNKLSGTVPSELGSLAHLQQLCLDSNELSGAIPPELGNLTNLEGLYINNNHLTGSIPSQMGNLTSLNDLWLQTNQLSGPIPPEIGNLVSLTSLNLSNNQLSGPIPSSVGNLTYLNELSLQTNQLSGSIPPETGSLVSLGSLYLSNNQLSGPMPSSLGNLTDLEHLDLSSNQLEGDIPSSFGYVEGSFPDGSVSYNGLYCSGVTQAFMNAYYPGWQNTQTVAPTNVNALGFGSGSAVVSWTPILYTADGGCYEVGVSQNSGGPYTFGLKNQTADKRASQITVTGLAPGANYVVVQTVTPGPNKDNQNTVTSAPSAEARVVTGASKSFADGALVEAEGAVTACFGECFYMENLDRSCGICVDDGGIAPGQGIVDVAGVMQTDSTGERFILASSVTLAGSGSVAPLGLANAVLGGGGTWGWVFVTDSTGSSQLQWRPSAGLSTFGLLVTTWGRVTAVGPTWFYVDDGCAVNDGSGNSGIYVNAEGLPCPPVGALVRVTGISSCQRGYLGDTVNSLLATSIVTSAQ